MEQLRVPKGWVNIKLKDEINILSGYAFNSKNFNSNKEGIPLIRIRNLQESNIDTYYLGPYKEEYIVKKNAILVGMDGEFYVIKWKNSKALLNQRICRIKALKNINEEYLFYGIKKHIKNIEDITGATTVKHLSTKDIEEINMIVPSEIREQEKIAKILSTLDKNIEKTTIAIEKYKKVKKGLMKELFTGKIRNKGREWVKETEFKYVECIGEIPTDWEVKKMGEYLEYISYGFTNPMPESNDGPYMVTAANVNNGVIEWSTARMTTKNAFEKLLTNKSKPKIGDILLTKDGTLGRLAIVNKADICINQSVAVLRVNKSCMVNRFLKLLLEYEYYQKKMLDNAGGSTIKHIYITVVDKMEIAVPNSLKEQEKIVERLDNIERLLNSEENYLGKLQSIKNGLMEDLLTGKKRVKI